MEWINGNLRHANETKLRTLEEAIKWMQMFF